MMANTDAISKESHEEAKKAAGFAAVEMLRDGMRVGLGTGSTTHHFIRHLGKRCLEGLKVNCVASSKASEQLADQCGVPMLDMSTVIALDVTVDGADQIDENRNMIKGGGGALLREKILASLSGEMIVIVDSSKVVKNFGSFPLPIEVVTFGFEAILERIRRQGYLVNIRRNKSGTYYITDGGNCILDLDLREVTTPLERIHEELRSIPGVIETGFFTGLAGRVIVGSDDGSVEIWDARPRRRTYADV